MIAEFDLDIDGLIFKSWTAPISMTKKVRDAPKVKLSERNPFSEILRDESSTIKWG